MRSRILFLTLVLATCAGAGYAANGSYSTNFPLTEESNF